MPGAPLPPSLNLPVPVTDLSAVRTGDQVALTWTMPKKTTDKVLLKGNIAVRVCRNETSRRALLRRRHACNSLLDPTPPSPTRFRLLSPPARRACSPILSSSSIARAVPPDSRTAPRSSPAKRRPQSKTSPRRCAKTACSCTGRPHQPNPRPSPSASSAGSSRPPAKKSDQGPLSQPAEPLEQTLLVESGSSLRSRARRHSIRFGETYEYRAQRVARVTVGGSTLELAGPLSPPLRIDAINVFPPGAPKGLAAVATAGENGSAPAIDLSWLPGTEANLAGYIVYRRELGSGSGAAAATWQRISPAQPVVGPGYHDANVQPGHTYAYAVTAIDQQATKARAPPKPPTPSPAHNHRKKSSLFELWFSNLEL